MDGLTTFHTHTLETCKVSVRIGKSDLARQAKLSAHSGANFQSLKFSAQTAPKPSFQDNDMACQREQNRLPA